MGVINSKCNEGKLTIFASGRIDSSNADAVEADIKAACAAASYQDIVFDADALEYISSAGLRVLLRLRKSNASLKVINASSDVYDVFEMTGFTEIIDIEKAYRKLSVDGCEIIGRGANGIVYRINPDTIIKLYMNSDSLPDIKKERELARKAFVLGIPTAIPYDVVKVGDKYGSVFELLNAKSFAKLIIESPQELEKYTQLYVELMKKIHSTLIKPGDMPDIKDTAMDWAQFVRPYLPGDKGEKLCKMFKNVPDTPNMIHGDYHIKNVMMQNDEVLLIDMDTICHGHPVFELSAMYNAYIGYSYFDHNVVADFLGIPYETAEKLWKRSLELYLDTTDEERIRDVENKAKVVSFTRILRRFIRRGDKSAPETAQQIEQLRAALIECLDKTDTLDF